MKLTKLSIANWFCLLAGIAVITLQIIRYFNATLQLTIGEVVVTLLASLLMFAPRAITEAAKKILNKKAE